ncbi:hypothetical protein BX616_000026 [Lobosporangium transversale]|uniref:Uncharacterized protein n=1 Tax=Lobosporangium transversale TaxID=64571 RepID=A0A1Y2G903_9FUNG|nr:hypothetical protein BCR41DRAFT_425853 [Lobosporangium transversale]KAF9919415.1 hypothetical protein BX616_000026 [Lobosporangium transversale]ORZ04553.1 hypothetical protein BCR41DRAFT_425853 [Lobosporangium transversale]|eukprot:XP_021876599.1 hypothetical protein BCR41DRAFT_425853 [Lobosporangium transversale]
MSDIATNESSLNPGQETHPRPRSRDESEEKKDFRAPSLSHSLQGANNNDSSNTSDTSKKLSGRVQNQGEGSHGSIFGYDSGDNSDISNKNVKTNREKLNRRPRLDENSENDHDSADDSDSDSDSDGDNGHRYSRRTGHGRGSKRRFSSSASHLLAQAPPVPDLRFDHNYRKALDQIYEAHARETAAIETTEEAAATVSASASEPSSWQSQKALKKQQVKSVPSLATRITVMTIRDIIIMPFVHGFFWGFGTILLTLASQRSLTSHLNRTWRRMLGDHPEDLPAISTRGEPARVRTSGSIGGFGNRGSGIGGIGLMSAASAAGPSTGL